MACPSVCLFRSEGSVERTTGARAQADAPHFTVTRSFGLPGAGATVVFRRQGMTRLVQASAEMYRRFFRVRIGVGSVGAASESPVSYLGRSERGPFRESMGDWPTSTATVEPCSPAGAASRPRPGGLCGLMLDYPRDNRRRVADVCRGMAKRPEFGA